MDTHEHGLKPEMRLNEKLDWLIEQWCERRVLRPLRFILQGYPGTLVHTDQFGDLLEKLRDVKGLCRNELTSNELACLIEVINEIEDSLKRSSKS